jgi:hypothetical protein
MLGKKKDGELGNAPLPVTLTALLPMMELREPIIPSSFESNVIRAASRAPVQFASLRTLSPAGICTRSKDFCGGHVEESRPKLLCLVQRFRPETTRSTVRRV